MSDSTKIILVIILIIVSSIELLFNRLRKLNNIPKPNVLRHFNFIYYIKYWQKVKKDVEKKRAFKFLINIHLLFYIISLIATALLIIATILFIIYAK
jgi:hypothetical protein